MTCLVGLVVWLLMVGLTAAPAEADGGPVPVEDRLYFSPQAWRTPDTYTVYASYFGFTQPSGSGTAGTLVHVALASCGDELRQQDFSLDDSDDGLLINLTPDGQFSVIENAVNARIGPSIDYDITVSQPGYDPYELTGEITGYGHRPSCATLHKPEVVVKRWSRIRGRALVGHTLSVTPTVAPGCHISYTWKAGAGAVGHGRRLLVKPRWRYLVISMVVKVTRQGYRSQSKHLRTRG